MWQVTYKWPGGDVWSQRRQSWDDSGEADALYTVHGHPGDLTVSWGNNHRTASLCVSAALWVFCLSGVRCGCICLCVCVCECVCACVRVCVCVCVCVSLGHWNAEGGTFFYSVHGDSSCSVSMVTEEAGTVGFSNRVCVCVCGVEGVEMDGEVSSWCVVITLMLA